MLGCIPTYSEFQKTGAFDMFWPSYFQGYFEDFPPPEPAAGDRTDSGSDDESESDVPLDSAEEELLAQTSLGKRKQKRERAKASKRARRVSNISFL